MEVAEPPVNGTSRAWLQWTMGIIMTVALAVSFATAKTVIEHGEQIATQAQKQVSTDDSIREFKADLKEIRSGIGRLERGMNVARTR